MKRIIKHPVRLTEKYRPRSFDAIVGQPEVVCALRNFCDDPCPAAFLFSGDTGVGKTSAAEVLAISLGCLRQIGGGIEEIPSGEQNSESVRNVLSQLRYVPMFGSGWKVCIINECERMQIQAETLWLDALESLPAKTVLVFTTNQPQKLESRFRDRCIHLRFISSIDSIRADTGKLLQEIYAGETSGKTIPERMLTDILSAAEERDETVKVMGLLDAVTVRMSIRRAIQKLQECMLAQ